MRKKTFSEEQIALALPEMPKGGVADSRYLPRECDSQAPAFSVIKTHHSFVPHFSPYLSPGL